MMMKFKSKKLTPELNEYVEQLREHFIESFTCFVHGIEESDKSKELFNYLPKVITFLQETCNKLYNPTIVTSLIFNDEVCDSSSTGLFEECFSFAHGHWKLLWTRFSSDYQFAAC